jgi:hypothetical protein
VFGVLQLVSWVALIADFNAKIDWNAVANVAFIIWLFVGVTIGILLLGYGYIKILEEL